MNQEQIIRKEMQISIDVKRQILEDSVLIERIADAGMRMADALKAGGKILACGNGGSASDAIHIAGEIVGRFQKERRAYAAIALNADLAVMTAVANDYDFDEVFARQVEGLMTAGDVLLGLSTSGNSANVIKAFEKAKEIGGTTILLSGKTGGKLRSMADIAIIVPSDVTAHIQEAHECIYHIFCGLIEEALT